MVFGPMKQDGSHAQEALSPRGDHHQAAPGEAADKQHSDHGSRFTSWVFTERVRQAGLRPSLGTVGDAYDNALVEAFWGRMQTELLDRQKWHTRVELAGAIFEYLEVFHNRTRRHSSLGMLTPIEYEQLHAEAAGVA